MFYSGGMNNDVSAQLAKAPLLEVVGDACALVALLIERLPTEFTSLVAGSDVLSLGTDGEVSSLPSTDLAEFAQSMEQLVRKTSALSGLHAAAAAQYYISSGRSLSSASVQVSEDLAIERGDACGRVERGRRANHREGQALCRGEITERQERAYAAIRESATGYLEQAQLDAFMDELLDDTRSRSAQTITRRGRKRLAQTCPEWARDRKRREHNDRSASLAMGPDGTRRLSIKLDSKSYAIVSSILARYARPGRLVGLFDDDGSLRYDGTTGFTPHRRPDGSPQPTSWEARLTERDDPRTTAQRNFDAILFALVRGMRVEGLTHGGLASIVVRMTPEELNFPDQLVETDAGAQISVANAVSLSGKNPWFVSCLRNGEEELYRIDVDAQARNRRSASSLQRVIMYAAYGGCTKPGCEEPAARTEAHHLKEWWRGGLTELSNLTQACTFHHAQVGEQPGKWRTIPVEGHPGLARWEKIAA